MKIQYCSDLHLEFPENKNFLEQHPIVPVGEILILAGDIVPFAVMCRYNDFFDELSANFEMVYWIPGNHEYYHFDIARKPNPLYESVRSNVILFNNQTVTYKNIELIFTTLWSYISPANQWQVQQNVNDFHLIKMNGSKFTTHQFNQLHQTGFEFLQQAVKQNSGMQKIIVSHHVPTLMHYPAQYKGSEINEAFAVELFRLLKRVMAAIGFTGTITVIPPILKLAAPSCLQTSWVMYKTTNTNYLIHQLLLKYE